MIDEHLLVDCLPFAMIEHWVWEMMECVGIVGNGVVLVRIVVVEAGSHQVVQYTGAWWLDRCEGWSCWGLVALIGTSVY